jgi:NAD(P)H-dependent FMN reductase
MKTKNKNLISTLSWWTALYNASYPGTVVNATELVTRTKLELSVSQPLGCLSATSQILSLVNDKETKKQISAIISLLTLNPTKVNKER